MVDSQGSPAPAVDTTVLFAGERALAKLLGGETVSPIAEGTYPVDTVLSLRLTGVVTKEAETSYAALPKVPLEALLAVLCRRARWGRADSKRIVGDCLRTLLNANGEAPHVRGMKDRVNDAKDVIEEERRSHLAAIPRAGATKWVGTVSIEVESP